MRVMLLLVLVLACACKRERPARHIALPPGPSAVLDPSPDATLPTTQPLIEARMEGGMAGGLWWMVQLWDDGTVGYSGYYCHGTHRATLSPARVRELEAALAEVNFDEPPARDIAIDGFTWSVRSGSRTLRRQQSSNQGLALPNALELIRTAVGVVPCDQMVLAIR